MGTLFRETFHLDSFCRRIHKRAWIRGEVSPLNDQRASEF